MIESRPAWTFTSANGIGNIQFWEDKVVGTWACLERRSGRLLWEKRFDRPNTIIGIGAGTIVAAETVSEMATLVVGCYGISLDSGELLWVSHGSGWWGALLRLLDSVPGFANDFRDSPLAVVEDKVVCSSGRILRLSDGAAVYKDEAASRRAGEASPPDNAWRLYSGEAVPIGSGTTMLCARPPGDTMEAQWGRAAAGDLVLCGLDGSGNVRWRFSSSALGWHVTGNYYSYRLSGRFVYLVACDGPPTAPISKDNPSIVKTVARNYRFAALDAATGEVRQDIPLGNGEQFSICAVGPDGLLLNLPANKLAYHLFV